MDGESKKTQSSKVDELFCRAREFVTKEKVIVAQKKTRSLSYEIEKKCHRTVMTWEISKPWSLHLKMALLIAL